MVKFLKEDGDLKNIEIVLTDFGMADPDSEGGTPIFASPECFQKKDQKSDIFSLGRVISYLLLPKDQFLKWVCVPIKDESERLSLKKLISETGIHRSLWDFSEPKG